MRRLQDSYELGCLLVVGVGREGDVIYRHLEWQLLPGHGRDLVRLRENSFGESSFNAVT